MERQAPRQVLYENQLPLAIESKSQRRMFFPEGGSVYGPTGGGRHPNIIRIPINADSLLDVQHSYLQFNFNNKSAGSCGLDIGVPFIRRLRIESGGTTLEDIEEYGKLYGGVLFPAQASAGAVADASITANGIGGSVGSLSATVDIANAQAVNDAGAGIGDTSAGNESANITQAIKNAVNSFNGAIGNVNSRTATTGLQHNTTAQLFPNEHLTYNVPLVSALMNMDKYLPLVMMNAGLTLEIELDVQNTAGCFRGADNNPGVGQNPVAGGDGDVWTISDVRYVAHLIDLQRDFYDKMRMVMEGSGGVLQLAGTTYRHYQGSTAGADTSATINIPSRVKSIKSVLFTQADQNAKTSATGFGVSNSYPNGLTEFQFRVGSVLYPASSVKATVGNVGGVAGSYQNRGEVYSELRKAFGTLGDYSEGGLSLSKETYLQNGSAAFTGLAGGGSAIALAGVVAPQPRFAPMGLDFEAFPKTALESGINTADRSLPMSLEIKKNALADASVVDVWCMCDAIFYVNLDGSVSVSI